MTRFGVPVALEGWTPAWELFLEATLTLARVLETGRWATLTLTLAMAELAVASGPEENKDRFAHDWDFFSFRLLDAELTVIVASGEFPFPLSPPSACSFFDSFLFADTATMRFHGRTLIGRTFEGFPGVVGGVVLGIFGVFAVLHRGVVSHRRRGVIKQRRLPVAGRQREHGTHDDALGGGSAEGSGGRDSRSTRESLTLQEESHAAAPPCPVVGPARSSPRVLFVGPAAPAPVSCRWSGPLQPPLSFRWSGLFQPPVSYRWSSQLKPPLVLSLVRPTQASPCPVVGPARSSPPVSCRWSGPLLPPLVLSLVRPAQASPCPVVGPARSSPPCPVVGVSVCTTLTRKPPSRMAAVSELSVLLFALISNIHAEELIFIRKESDSFTFELPEEASSCLISRLLVRRSWSCGTPLTSGPRTPQYLKT
ncbi:hypothetical protein F7725_004094 [Dissostichus mawsoni]|uniref:Uncharacterized protein n=1 Tax=Dissostichus mawsoni TaxID=36200 RepID=A0A7J5YC27_DISMA|nr:hypothetical protein F7725_004094 [Dissostichus mawsoni]